MTTMESQLVDDSAPSFEPDSETQNPTSPLVQFVQITQDSPKSPDLLDQVIEDTPESEISKRGNMMKHTLKKRPSSSIAKKLDFDDVKLDDPSDLLLTSESLGLDSLVGSSLDGSQVSFTVSNSTSGGGRRSRRNSLDSSGRLRERNWRRRQRKVTSQKPFLLRTEVCYIL
ncbi:hypothetical protein AgCh_016055 [Apium graveolens]